MDGQPLALVTGAAHRVGKALALALARRGYAILLHHHHAADQAVITADEIRSLSMPAYPVQADLTDETDIIRLLSTIDSLPHQLKILINSASIMQKTNLRETSSSDWDATFAINLRTPFFLTQQIAKRMVVGGLIVNITDAGAHKPWTGYPAYVVSKLALEALTRLQAKTYAPDIRVNAIAPGLVLPSGNVTPAEWEKLVVSIPLKHSISLEDVAAALTFLLDNQSITGQTIVVDGGYSLT